jgi:hypothetical protein
VTKICESFAGGFARVGRTLDRPPQPVEGVLHLQKSGEVVEIYGGLWAVRTGIQAIRVALGHLGILCKWRKAA